MIKIDSIGEQLMYNTLKLETSEGTGTGFIFEFAIDDKKVPVIITNKHVVNNKEIEDVKFSVHITDDKGEPTESFDINLHSQWFFHPKYDLCCTPLAPILQHINENIHKSIFYRTLEEVNILTNNESEELNTQEEVTMIGYPRGLWDSYNKLPIFRKGYTAFHPGIDFNNESLGIVDMACFPGSSGSPIFLYSEGVYSNKKGSAFIGKRCKLMGILFSGPTIQTTGQVIDLQTLKSISISENMINLGYYIKARELLYFKSVFEPLVKNEK